MQEDFLKINPQHTVPTIVDDDYVLWESKAIATYLVEQYKPDSALYPTDPKERGIVNQRLYFDSTVLFARTFAIVAPIMRQGATTIPQEKKDALKEALGTLNGYLEGQEWVAGVNCTVADLCLVATVSTLDKLGVDLTEFANIIDWYERCKALPGYDENEEGANAFGGFIKSKLEEPY
ncbi:glutathione S-transferase 1-like isoform X2 [Toxorhynchites rutilus septentrionalis]|nr:glutathione S-transferase 1-like isoform X2 [Toxorhynchites rutilus septentrionalis]XP_055641163.1 glutathione S-transferase 1-like isoform X2 [Toxorhynchites rutilus septentrionalis]